MKLKPSQIQEFLQALLSAYNAPQGFEQMVFFTLEKPIHEITSPSVDLSMQVFEVIKWTIAQNRIEEFVEGAFEMNPENYKIKKVFKSIMKDEAKNNGDKVLSVNADHSMVFDGVTVGGNFEVSKGDVNYNNGFSKHKVENTENNITENKDEKFKILFISSLPNNKENLRFDDEIKAIKENIEKSKLRDKIDFEAETAVNYDEIYEKITEYKPDILHISVHSSRTKGLIFSDDDKNTIYLNGEKIKRIFEFNKDNIFHNKCIILNACNSSEVAKGLTQNTDYLISMKDFIPDDAAIKFTKGFYKQLLKKDFDVETAFNSAVFVLEMIDTDSDEPLNEIPVITKN